MSSITRAVRAIRLWWDSTAPPPPPIPQPPIPHIPHDPNLARILEFIREDRIANHELLNSLIKSIDSQLPYSNQATSPSTPSVVKSGYLTAEESLQRDAEEFVRQFVSQNEGMILDGVTIGGPVDQPR